MLQAANAVLLKPFKGSYFFWQLLYMYLVLAVGCCN